MAQTKFQVGDLVTISQKIRRYCPTYSAEHEGGYSSFWRKKRINSDLRFFLREKDIGVIVKICCSNLGHRTVYEVRFIQSEITFYLHENELKWRR
jgi:hypothetical protein